ncbi:MAG TPA: hypothetical protein VEL79_22800 [Vicinamibacterales bacterium]|nr:hypothetical protein [Vicinamibacterales bacterium]
MSRHVIFVPLAGNQARFYLSVARVLSTRGVRVSFVTFHEPSLDALTAGGFEAISAFRGRPAPPRDLRDALGRIAPFNVPDVSLTISHERAAYEIRDGAALVMKFAGHLEGAAAALDRLAAGDRDTEVVQEVGGFLSVAATYYAARRIGLRNTFTEPSFFRRRLFFTHNSYAAPSVDAPPRPATAEVQAYLEETLAAKRIAIPVKDQAHYRSAAKKLLSGYNVRRLVEKGLDKYVRGQQEEFDHLGGHVGRHLRMLRTARRLKPLYCELPAEPFIYYPFHVPADVALTIRAPEYYDQCALLDYLARAVPPTHLLIIKEHPALIGAVAHSRISDLLRRYDHIRLLRPTINNHDVLAAADAIVTINSKSGAEGLLRGRRVVALGDSFYRASGLVATVDRPSDLPAVLRRTLAAAPPAPEDIGRFFQQVYDTSYPGELYLDTPDNCEAFTASLASSLNLTQAESAIRA